MGRPQVEIDIAYIGHLHAAPRKPALHPRQLSELHNPIWRQQQAPDLQADLRQALHRTEQMARRVRAATSADRFAAAVLAHLWKSTIQGIAAVSFTSFADRRAWEDAIDVLDVAAAGARADAACSAYVTKYLACIDEYHRLRARLGDAGEEQVLEAGRAQRAAAACKARSLLGVVAVGATAALAAVVFFLAGPGALRTAGLVLSLLASAALVAIGYTWFASDKRQAWAAEELTQARRHAADYRAFMSSAQGGAWLERVWTEHPLLFR